MMTQFVSLPASVPPELLAAELLDTVESLSTELYVPPAFRAEFLVTKQFTSIPAYAPPPTLATEFPERVHPIRSELKAPPPLKLTLFVNMQLVNVPRKAPPPLPFAQFRTSTQLVKMAFVDAHQTPPPDRSLTRSPPIRV